MPRIVAATSLIASSTAWCALVVAGARHGKLPVSLPAPALGAGLGILALVSLALAIGIVLRKPRAHCASGLLHVAGIAGSLAGAKLVCPMLLVATGIHVLGLLSARGARRQLCKAPAATVV